MSTEKKQDVKELIEKFNSSFTSLETINKIIKDVNKLNYKGKRDFYLFFFDSTNNKTIVSNKMILFSILLRKANFFNEIIKSELKK